MPAISKTSQLGYDLLWYISVDDDGWLTTPDTVVFQVEDASGAAVYPTPGDPTAWKAALLRTTGWYYPDWTPDGALPDGEYTVNWKATTGAVDTERRQEFILVPAGEGDNWPSYVSVAEVYQSPLVDIDPTIVTPGMLSQLVAVYQQLIEEYCGQKFMPYLATLKRATAGTILHLKEPVIGVGQIQEVVGVGANRGYTEVTDTDVTIHHFREDGALKNPKLTRASSSLLEMWVEGVFGYLDPQSWECPYGVRLALLKAILKHAEELEADAALLPVGPVEEEQVDKHRVKYGSVTSTKVGSLANLIFGSPEIRALLSMYRRPTSMRTV